MNRKLLPLVATALCLAAPLVLGQEEKASELTGSVSLGIRNVTSTANDPSKLNEYRDLESGANGVLGAELRRRGETDYLNLYGENLGRDDQYLDLSGGRYGTYKYRLFADDLRHNFGSGPGARSPYSGIGSNVLTATLPNTNVATWNQFDHSYKRRDWGGLFELQATSPWYFRVEANEVKREGINVLAGAQGTSPGNGFMDLPTPIDYTTRTYTGEVGYSAGRSHASLNIQHSTFDNGNEVLRWQNGFFGGMDTTVLPPSNEQSRIALNANIRRLPSESTLAARFTYSRHTSNTAMQQTMLSTGATNPATNPSDPSFRGDVRRTSFSTALSSRPASALDTRVYYNFNQETNDSTEITFNPAVGSGLRGGSTNPLVNCANVAGTLCTPEHFHYTKNNIGAEAGYRLTAANKLSGGYDYLHTHRERPDFRHTRDRKWYVEWKNSSLESLSGRIKFQRLVRHSTFDADASILAANPMDLYVRRFDFANVDQNLVKLVLDATPLPHLDLGFEAIFKRNAYTDSPLGRKDDTRQEYYASIAYGDPSRFRVLLFGDIEFVKYDSTHRVGTGNPNPNTAPNATTYNWDSTIKDRSWQMGVGADWLPRSRLTLKSSFLYAETKGEVDFMVQPGGAAGPFLRIPNFHNSRRTSLTLRAIYEYSKQWEFTGGYAYERYTFSDISYDNTTYVAGAGTSAAYTTGQYAFQPYSANIVYGIAKYRF